MEENSVLNLSRQTSSSKETFPAKVLQFGGGNFLRGFVDWMIDELNQQTSFDGSVIIVKPTERGDYEALRKQDGLFHVLTQGVKEGKLFSQVDLVQCVSQIIHPYLEWASYLETARIPSIRFIVSNTTESGIKSNRTDLFSHNPPKEFPAKLTHWLYHRYTHFGNNSAFGCIILPCELIENNGQNLKKCILEYADWWSLSPAFITWVEESNVFCNTLVDRIIPGFPKDQAEQIFKELGYHDDLLVAAEPYHIWAIETTADLREELPFGATNLNVVFTDDLTPYRTLKVRILNGLHTSMVPIGYLIGIDTVRDSLDHINLSKFLHALVHEEIVPTLDYPPDVVDKYVSDVMDRFRNPYIEHYLLSISLNSISKFRVRVLPSLLHYWKNRQVLPSRLVFAFASVLWFYRGIRNQEVIPLNDNQEVLDYFKSLWESHRNKTQSLENILKSMLSNSSFWGQDLCLVPGLHELITKYLKRIEQKGFTNGFNDFFVSNND